MPENHTPLSCFKIDGLKFASKATQKPSIFVSKIINFQNQSLSYSLPINPKARCIKSCWPCIDYAYETLLQNYSREYFYKVKTKKEKALRKKLPLLYREKSPFCSGVLQNSLHLVYICFHHNKKYPSIIQRKIQVLLMCFEKNL